MKNFVQNGDSITLIAPYAVSAGQGVLVGQVFGVASFDAAISTAVETLTEGVFDITKEPALAIAQGARLFWDNTNRRVTTVQPGNFPIGACTVAALAADTTVRAWIDGQAALTVGAVGSRSVSLPVTAVANTDFTVTLPPCNILRVTQRTTVAYTGTTVTGQVGTTSGGTEIVAAADIKAIASRTPAVVDANTASFTPFAGGSIFIRIIQTGPTAVGAGRFVIEFEPTT